MILAKQGFDEPWWDADFQFPLTGALQVKRTTKVISSLLQVLGGRREICLSVAAAAAAWTSGRCSTDSAVLLYP